MLLLIVVGCTSVKFVALQLKNQAGTDALIMTSDNQPRQGLSVRTLMQFLSIYNTRFFARDFKQHI